MAWGQAYFSGGGRTEEDEDMVDPIDYFIGGYWTPHPWSSTNSWACLYVHLSFCIKLQYFITLFIVLDFAWKLTRVFVFDWFTHALVYFVLLA